jgi:hypothetical protein
MFELRIFCTQGWASGLGSNEVAGCWQCGGCEKVDCNYGAAAAAAK